MAKRIRAVALIRKENKFLLVRDRGVSSFLLPGGRIEENETVLGAAIREIYEETGLEAVKAIRLKELDYEGEKNIHKTCFLKVDNYNIRLNTKELKDYVWWDGEEDIPAYKHVKKIISKFKKLKEFVK